MRPGLRHGARLLCVALLPLVLAAGASSRPLALAPVTGWLTYGNAPTRTGDAGTRLDPSALRATWFADLEGVVTTQPLVARNVPGAGQSTVYVGVSSGRFEALAPNGYVRWRVELGVQPQACRQLPTWGVTGTPVIDAATRAIYVADAFGWLHALDLVTGRERAGWPVRLYDDPDQELVWGALASIDGSIYVGTGSYCDQPMVGKLIRVELATRRTTTWVSVPPSLGGGGSIWGWGSVAYSPADDALFVVTGNAFEGGSNTGADFTEAAGYGERLVELTRDLKVVASSHPQDVLSGNDSDFIGSPVIAQTPDCGEVIAGANKNGVLYFWHGDHVASGPFASVATQPLDFDRPVLMNPVYDAASRSYFVVTSSQLVRVTVAADCRPDVTWRTTLPTSSPAGSPTVAGDMVWLTQSGGPALLLGYDTATGSLRFRRNLGDVSFAGPTIVDRRLFEDARHGFAAGARASRPVTTVGTPAELSSWLDARHRWVSRENGVFASDDGGHSWRRIFARPAQRVVRTSLSSGLISVGVAPTSCNCTGRRLFTRDGGRTWHGAPEIGPSFDGRGGTLLWWSGRSLNRAASWPPRAGVLRSRVVATFSQPVVDATAIPNGAAALLTNAGRGFDVAPKLAFVRSGLVRQLAVPPARGDVLVTGLDVSWPLLTIHGAGVNGDALAVTWRSRDGGRRWSVTQKSR